ncbi:hypothetical protein [Demequina sp.]|uniref:hypothetical protein n=1 Tax=Demequina sp. TaxID=2050685 RepID=UPI003D0B44D2
MAVADIPFGAIRLGTTPASLADALGIEPNTCGDASNVYFESEDGWELNVHTDEGDGTGDYLAWPLTLIAVNQTQWHESVVDEPFGPVGAGGLQLGMSLEALLKSAGEPSATLLGDTHVFPWGEETFDLYEFERLDGTPYVVTVMDGAVVSFVTPATVDDFRYSLYCD